MMMMIMMMTTTTMMMMMMMMSTLIAHDSINLNAQCAEAGGGWVGGIERKS